MSAVRCPHCGRGRNVRRDGCFAKHDRGAARMERTLGVWVASRERCPGSGLSAAAVVAEIALTAAENRAALWRKHLDQRIAGRDAHLARYDAETAKVRAVAESGDRAVAEARAALDALRGPS